MMRVSVLLCLALASCNPAPKVPEEQLGGAVYTTFYPTTYLAERIAGGLVPIVCPLPEGGDPISWRPSRDVLAEYQSAKLIVLNGIGLEKWVETASLPAGRVLESCWLNPDEVVRYEDITVHKHGPGGEHAHEGIDAHTWLDHALAARQANCIYLEMQSRWPQHAGAMSKNLKPLLDDLVALAERLKTIKPAPLLASHPAYNYLAFRFKWQIANLDLDPEVMPDEKQLAEIRSRLEEHPAKLLLWESEPLPEIATKLETAFGLQSIVFSPCESKPAGGEDYLSVMNANLDRLTNAGR